MVSTSPPQHGGFLVEASSKYLQPNSAWIDAFLVGMDIIISWQSNFSKTPTLVLIHQLAANGSMFAITETFGSYPWFGALNLDTPKNPDTSRIE